MNCYYLIILLLLNNSSNFIYGLKVDDIYTPSKNEFYPFNPTYPNPNACKMNYVYKITHSSIGIEYKVDYNGNSITTYQSEDAISKISSTETLLNIIFYTNTGNGDYQLNITDKSSGERFTKTIKTFCNENISPSSFIVNDKTGLVYDRLENRYKAIINITGSSYNFINGFCYSFYKDIQYEIACSFKLFSDSLYYLSIDMDYPNFVFINGFIQVNITVGDPYDNQNPYTDYYFKLNIPSNDFINTLLGDYYGGPNIADQILNKVGINSLLTASFCFDSFLPNPFIAYGFKSILPSYRNSNQLYCFFGSIYSVGLDTPIEIVIRNNTKVDRHIQVNGYTSVFEGSSFSVNSLAIKAKTLKMTKSTQIQIITVSTTFNNYIEQPIKFSLIDSNIRNYPYGLINNQQTQLLNYLFEYSVILSYSSVSLSQSVTSQISSEIFSLESVKLDFGSSIPMIENPIIVSNLIVKHVSNDIYSMKFDFNCLRGLMYFNLFEQIYDLRYLSSGDFKNGTMDFYFNYFGGSFTNSRILLQTINYETEILDFYISNIYNRDINLYESLKNIHFQYKEVTLTNQSITNIAYFTIDGSDPNQPVAFYTRNAHDNITNWATFNHSLKLWQVTFEMSANILPGYYSYAIALSEENYIKNIFLPKEYQITVISENFDLLGPYISDLKQFPQISNNGESVSEFGFMFKIFEDYNQFSEGYIKIVSDDGVSVIKNLKFKDTSKGYISGNGFVGDYKVSISNDISKCIPRIWIITEVVLKDTQGINSTFYRTKYDEPISDALKKYSNSPDIIKIEITCSSNSQPSQIAYPTLSSLRFINRDTNIDVSTIDSGVPANYSIAVECDINSGVSSYDTNVVYLVDHMDRVIESKVTRKTTFSDKVIFYHDFEFGEIAFGYPLGFTINYYGLLGQFKQIIGYTSNDLLSIDQPSYIESELSLLNSFIMKSTKLTMLGGDVYLFGRKFTLASKVYLIIDSITSSTEFTIHSDSILKIVVPPLKSNNDVKVYIQQNGSPVKYSNTFIIQSQYSNLNSYKTIEGNQPIGPPLPPLTPPPIESSSEEVIPTNPPQKCLGNPICGGPLNGYCTSSGCKCLSPFIGLSCESKVPDIPKPDPNENDPNSTLVIDEKELFAGMISLYSIREININGDIINTYYFKNWTRSNSTFSQNIYYYNTTIENGALFNVTLEWFNKNQNISFANQEFEMYKSSLKYSIEISSFKFNNSLTSLQLVMSATVQSLSDKICSSKDFGNTTVDNSNYIKLKLKDKSLYGRFIKRGIIDNYKIVPISNILLDSSLNPIETSSKTQAYIGISIPHFIERALIDPDFSILVDGNKVTSKDNNSICSNKAKLTSSQLAGIVVGSVVAVSIIVAVSITIYKNKIRSKEMNNIKLKMKQMNETNS